MTGTFSIKRRLQGSQRPQGQSSQLGVLQALGIGVGRSSPHTGSKPGYKHLTDVRPRLRFDAAQQWSRSTGRPLPPGLKPRTPLQPPAALTTRARAVAYLAQDSPVAEALLSPLTTGDLLDSPLFTRNQRRRIVHKAGQHGEIPAGWRPDRPPAAPRAPKSVAARRRFRKDAAQRARHENRRPGYDPAA